ncbi:MAG: calcium-binding protein [Planktomarina sp.]
MGIFEFRGIIVDDFVNAPLGVGRFQTQGNTVVLASDIQDGAITLTLNAGRIAATNPAYTITSTSPTQNVAWGDDTLEFAVADLNAVLTAAPDSSVALYANNSGAAADHFEGIAFEIGNKMYMALANANGTGFATYAVAGNGALTERTRIDGSDGGYADSPASMALVKFGDTQILITISATNDSVSSFAIGSSGQLTHTETIGIEDFLPVSTPQDVAAISVAGQQFVVMASSDTSSLTMFEITRSGNLTAVDQVVDNLSTRLDDVHVIETFTIDDRSFVLAAGQDSGISLFGVLPDGQLLHLDTVVDQTNFPIDTITDMHVAEVDGDYQLFTVSGSEAGIGQFSLNLGDLGVTATVDSQNVQGSAADDVLILDDADRVIDAGDGDDIIKDGKGQNTMIGGNGADLFVLTSDGKGDVITDFDPAQDKLDLSHWPMLNSVDQLAITETAIGVQITYQNETLEILSASGGPLSASDFTDANTLNATHVETSFDFDNTNTTTLADIKSSATAGGNPSSSGNITGSAADNVLVGNASDQTLQGNEGHDILRGGNGADALFGGSGIDLADYADANSGVRADLANSDVNTGFADGDTYSGIEGITGTQFGDVLGGDSAGNIFFGEAGDDVVRAQDGNDVSYGGDGVDWMDGGTGNDTLDGGVGDDALLGRTGNDVIYGGEGDDNIAAHNGDDEVYGGAGDDQLGGSNGDDRMFGGSGKDVIGSGANEDYINAGLGDDVASGGYGQDEVHGGGGNDTLAGSYGDDIVTGGDGNDDMGGGTGTDEMYAGDGDDKIGAGDDDDYAFGGSGNDFLGGGNGDDALFGGEGRDTINAGDGDDILNGGSGNDIYVFNSFTNGEIDTIADWNAAEDLIRLRKVEGRFSALEISTVTVDGTDYTEIAYEGHRIRLADTDAASITQDDFIFLG